MTGFFEKSMGTAAALLFVLSIILLVSRRCVGPANVERDG